MEKYASSNPTRFHTPGHKGRGINKIARNFRQNLFSWDVTEVPGLDDLHQPRGPIEKAQKKLAKLYGADHSFFLVNGATSGVLAMMGATLKPGDKILISRASHHSVLSGLILSGASPVYIMPEQDNTLGVYTQITPKSIAEALENNLKPRALLVTNPVYQGFCPDLGGISRVIDKTDILLLVDEAHGPHFGFSPKLPRGACSFPVDAWVQSPHKLLSSFTQSAWLHLKGEKIYKDRVQQFLQMISTSSPSYLFMASLDYARAMMESNGRKLVERSLRLAQIARKYINKKTPFYCVGSEIKGKNGVYDIDLSRLMVNVSQGGFTGYAVERTLRQRFNIYAEYSDLYNVYFLISYSNTYKDIKRLIRALSSLKEKKHPIGFTPLPKSLPYRAMEPRKAYYSKGKTVPIKNARGHIAKQALVPYPPGIPLIMPGEIIEDIHIDMILNILALGGSCQGVKDEDKIYVIK